MTKRKKDRIQTALSYDPFFDTDKDGVPNILDCAPLNPKKDGFFGDIGRAAKKRVKAEVTELKERTIESIAGEEAREQRGELRKAEHEAYLEKAKEQVAERGREKARAKYEKRKPLLVGLLGGVEDDDLSEFGEDVKKTIKKAGKHGKRILRETSKPRIKTRTPDVKLPDTSIGGITGRDALSGVLRTIEPTKRRTKVSVRTKMPDVASPDIRW